MQKILHYVGFSTLCRIFYIDDEVDVDDEVTTPDTTATHLIPALLFFFLIVYNYFYLAVYLGEELLLCFKYCKTSPYSYFFICLKHRSKVELKINRKTRKLYTIPCEECLVHRTKNFAPQLEITAKWQKVTSRG